MQNSWSQDLYIRTYAFAARAHRGQTMPGTELPYVMHLSFVSTEIIAALSAEKGYDENFALQCALLHDVIEDTKVTYDQVKEEFGEAVADAVLALSKDKTIAKHLRMTDSLRRIRQRPREVWMVKLADRISNLLPPPSHWAKERIARYREEAVEILDSLGDASELLSRRLGRRIDEYKAYSG